MASRFLSNININDEYTLPSADGTANQIIQTDGAGNLTFVDQSDIVAGESEKTSKVVLAVKNVSGGTLNKGTVVHAAPTASPPSGNVIEVIAAENDVAASMPAIGVLNEQLADDAEGEAVMFGRVSGIDTSSFSVGDELFVSDTAGAFTATKPTGTKLIQKIAVVIKVHASNGTIEVFGAGRTNDVPTPLYVDHDNQRLGIGTSSPTETLDIRGNVHVEASSPSITLKHTSGFAQNYSITNDSNLVIEKNGTDGGGKFIIKDENDLTPFTASFDLSSPDVVISGDLIAKDKTGTTQHFIVKENNGKVGIGTTNPAYALDIVSSQTNVLRLTSTGSTSGILFEDSNTTDTVAVQSEGDNLQFRVDNGHINFKTNTGASAVTRMRITSDGDVGIGTTSPSKKLEVNEGYILSSGAGTSHGFELQRTGLDTYQLRHLDGGLTVFNNTDSRKEMTFDGAGNVGIGTTSPSQKLDVAGDATFDGRIYTNATALASVGILGKAIANGWAARYDSNDANYSGFFFDANNDASMYLRDDAGNTNVLLRSDSTSYLNGGNVGIGTTSPASRLEVNGEIDANGGDGYRIETKPWANWASDLLTLGDWDGEGYATRIMGSNSSEVMRVTGTNVGIGTTSPSNKLEVVTNSSGPCVKIVNESGTGGAGLSIHGGSGTSSDIITLHDKDGNERMMVRGDGNVGIGTTSPTETLDVNGTVNLTNLKVSTAQGSDGQVLTSTGSGVAWESLPNTTQTILNSNFIDSGSTTLAMRIPFNTLTETNSNQYYNHIDCPADGSVKRFRIQNTSGSMSTSFTTELMIFKNGSTTPTGSGELSIATDQNGGNYVSWDPSNYTFEEGDKLQFAFQKSASNKLWQGVSASVIIEFEKV